MSADTTSDAARRLSRAGSLLHECAAAERAGADFSATKRQAIDLAMDALRLLRVDPCVGCRLADAQLEDADTGVHGVPT